jgi:hypothetical protein
MGRRKRGTDDGGMKCKRWRRNGSHWNERSSFVRNRGDCGDMGYEMGS